VDGLSAKGSAPSGALAPGAEPEPLAAAPLIPSGAGALRARPPRPHVQAARVGGLAEPSPRAAHHAGRAVHLYGAGHQLRSRCRNRVSPAARQSARPHTAPERPPRQRPAGRPPHPTTATGRPPGWPAPPPNTGAVHREPGGLAAILVRPPLHILHDPVAGLDGPAASRAGALEPRAQPPNLTRHTAVLASSSASGLAVASDNRAHRSWRERLEAWASQAQDSPVSELRGFARGLRTDWAAVTAGLTVSYSSGAVEGNVNF
jgi:hypothetical protein